MKWELTGNHLALRHPSREIHWEMPDGFRMPSPALLNLAEYLLLKGFGVQVPQQGERTFGTRVAVAYSGGVDSTAALSLLPDALPIYTEVAKPGSLHKLDNALLALADVNGIAVRTNADELALEYGKKRGYYGTGGFTVCAVLLADHFGIGTIADGNVLETIYLYSTHGHGTRYTPKSYDEVFRRFAAAGIHYCIPCAGLTEVSTTKIAAGARYAMGCMRGVGGKPCNDCAKCYRKRALQGTPIPPCKESEAKVQRAVIPMLPSLLWAVRRKGLTHPVLDPIEKDIEWVDKWYADSIRYIPEHLRPYFLKRLADLGIEPLVDDAPIRNWVSDRGG